MEIRHFDSDLELGLAAAHIALEGIQQAAREGRSFILGCPGGRSPRSTYQSLAALIAESHTSINHLFIAMMDEYAWQDPDGNFHNVDPDSHFSCVNFAFSEIFEVLNADLAPALRMPRTQVLYPLAQAPDAYETLLQELKVDLFLLASGASDGHVAFNGVGTSRETGTRIAALSFETRTDNLGTFPEFNSIDEVPVFGVTVGPATIASVSKSAIMLIQGDHKHQAYLRISEAQGYEEDWPATIALECQNSRLFADRLSLRSN